MTDKIGVAVVGVGFVARAISKVNLKKIVRALTHRLFEM
jgi:hypothetical protein